MRLIRNKLTLAALLALALGCSPNKVESMCGWDYPIQAEECTLEIKMKKGRSIYCGCEKDEVDFEGCKYVHTRGHDIYLCGTGLTPRSREK